MDLVQFTLLNIDLFRDFLKSAYNYRSWVGPYSKSGLFLNADRDRVSEGFFDCKVPERGRITEFQSSPFHASGAVYQGLQRLVILFG